MVKGGLSHHEGESLFRLIGSLESLLDKPKLPTLFETAPPLGNPRSLGRSQSLATEKQIATLSVENPCPLPPPKVGLEEMEPKVPVEELQPDSVHE